MRFAHISDFHYTKAPSNPLRLFSKRILATVNWHLNRKKKVSFDQLQLLPKLFESLNIDWVLLGGDFSSSSTEEEFELMKDFIGKLNQPRIAIPGNHDQYTKRSYQTKRFYRYFSNEVPSALSLSEHRLECFEIKPGWHLISLDTSSPTSFVSSEGIFSRALEELLKNCLKEIPPDEKIILFNHYPFFPQEDLKRSLKRGEALEKILRDHPNICLYLHGHTHRHSIADLQPEGLPITMDSGSCTFLSGGSWNLIEIHPKGCSVDTFQFFDGWKKHKTQEFLWNR